MVEMPDMPQRKVVKPHTMERFTPFDVDFFNDSNRSLLVMVAGARVDTHGKVFVKVWEDR